MNEKPVVLLTGASKGLGAATVRWLGRAGANVVMVARSEKALNAVAAGLAATGGSALPMVADLADPSSCRRVVENALKHFHKIDALINNAAVIAPLSAIEDADVEAWRYAIETNLVAPFCLIKFALPALKLGCGRVVNVTSGAARTPIAAASAYCVSKAGLTHLTRVLAEEAPEITVVSVRPGVVDTDMQKQLRTRGREALKPEQYAYYKNLKTAKILEAPAVPARSIAWLALSAPRHMSGEFRSYDDKDIQEPARIFFGRQTAID